MIRLIAVLAILFIVVPGNAQSLANIGDNYNSGDKLVNFSASEWSFFHDASINSFYIDFETVDVNLSDLKVLNTDGKVLFQDNLQDLPVDAIYELDLSDYPKGDYLVEIRTFTGLITKQISLK